MPVLRGHSRSMPRNMCPLICLSPTVPVPPVSEGKSISVQAKLNATTQPYGQGWGVR